jgi:hypothetical protein
VGTSAVPGHFEEEKINLSLPGFNCPFTKSPYRLHYTGSLRARFFMLVYEQSDPSGRAVKGVFLWPLACWHYGFDSRRSVVCCQV